MPQEFRRKRDRGGVGAGALEELDAYSYESHRRAVAAIDEGRFEREIVPVETGAAVLPSFRRGRRPVETRLSRSLLASARLASDGHHRGELEFDRGRIGRDAPREWRSRRATRTHAARQVRVLRFLRVSIRIGCCTGTRARARGRSRRRLTWDDISVIEVNEAFASVVLQFLADSGLHERWEGGRRQPERARISLGHPLGATGCADHRHAS